MKHLKRYWVMYTLLVVAIGLVIYFNWDTIKGWFSSPAEQEVNRVISAARGKCQDIGGGDCLYYGLAVPCKACADHGLVIVK